jgi:GcrA cell cycle regulator
MNPYPLHRRPDAAGQPWSPDAVARLEALWRAGELSAAAIARTLGVTRNAVLGKVHRLGLSRGDSRRAAIRTSPQPAPTRKRRTVTRPAGDRRGPVAPNDLALVADLAALPRDGCHWPVGDPAQPGFGFCGRPMAGAGPYCDAHRRMAYRGPGVSLEQLTGGRL